jgi:predicted ATPase/DNA-binding CsgD family transcriptional regulator/DNA-binding XRE family transcriptional regulator
MATTAKPGLFALLVQRYRAAAGLSQEELAERAALSRRGISDLERGERRSPRPATVRRLVEALDLAPADRSALLASAQHAATLRPSQVVALPVPPSPLVGRERELAELRRLLDRSRLLTITGAGGSGKTRLALEAVRVSADDFANGAALVLLAPLADAEFVAPAIAQVLGIRDIVGRPLRETLITKLRPRQLLLMLDNFEHLLDAAPLVSDLLAACPRLTVLATSREALHLREEQQFPLPPLQLPQTDRNAAARVLFECASVELFRQRAAQFAPDFRLSPESARIVADICLRLDGLPLAIELAAARTRVLSPTLLLERLDSRLPLLVGGARDLPARQRTLRDTIGWSHELLGLDDRQLFRRLAVFAGGCTLRAAEAVSADDSVSGQSVLDGLQSLVDKNLVQRERGADDEPRFTMLETIREFALEQIQLSGELEDVRRRHAGYYLTWLAAANSRQLAEHPRGWFHRLDIEYDNLRAAVRWSLDHGDLAMVLRAGPALTRYGHLRGYLRELREWWQDALTHSVGAEPADWPTAACLLAIVLFLHRDEQAIFPLLDESLTRFRAQGHRQGMAHVLMQLGSAAPLRGDPSAGIPLLHEADAIFCDLGQREDVAWTSMCLGNITQQQGDYASADVHYTKALSIVRDVRQPNTVSQAIALEGLEVSVLTSLGSVALVRRDLDRSEACLREAALLSVQLASPELLAVCALHLAGVALGRGMATRAARLLGGAEGLWGAVDSSMLPVFRAIYDGIRSDLDRRLGEQAAGKARGLGQRMSLRQVAAYALGPTEIAAADDPLRALTRREREVAHLAATGLSNREIARAMSFAEGTARIHIERILAKLDLHSRAQLAAWVVRHGVDFGNSDVLESVRPR